MTATVGRADAFSGPDPAARLPPRWEVVSRPFGPGADRSSGTAATAPTPSRADVLVPLDGGQAGTASRLHELFDRTCDRLGRRGARLRTAVDYGEVTFSYAELAALSNRLANHLADEGIGHGDRVGLLLDRTIGSHASVLALSRLGATWVPLDPGFPDDRIAYLLNDAGVTTVITLTRLAGRLARSPVEVIELDAVQHRIARRPSSPPIPHRTGGRDRDPICYIIYTSGSTGRPKGVPVRHSSICNFVEVAARVYGYRPSDRVYQGMTTAFDFSVEELWVPLAVGATLVPAPGDVHLVGPDLGDFLDQRRVSALCCVPTLLATLDRDLPALRFLLVSGEACPPDVIGPWLTPGRRVLNAYGPTETTVTCTWSVLAGGDRSGSGGEPGGPAAEVTIGGPLPTYSVVLLDPDRDVPVPAGQVGEIAVGGAGVAEGYLNQPERTARSFLPDTIGLPGNTSGRIYRTGDLGRITATNEIEFLGRIDTQVKIRGYRIELDEIAAVARTVDGVGQAVIETWDPTGGGVELVAYLTRARPDRPVDVDAVHRALGDALPAYMVPAWYEELEELPLLPSTKVDRGALPQPSGPRHQGSRGGWVAPRTEAEAAVASLLGAVLGAGAGGVSVEAHFFDDLGADSLRLAELATAIRAELGVRRLSMRKLYENPTVALVAALVDPLSPQLAAPAVAGAPHGAPAEGSGPEPVGGNRGDPVPGAGDPVPAIPSGPAAVVTGPGADAPRAAGTMADVATGAAQLVAYLVTAFVAALAGALAVDWVGATSRPVDLYGRAVVAGTALYLGSGIALIAVKWVAVGRFRAERVPLRSVRYLRFWVARNAIRMNPFNLWVGTPIYNTYLRALGVGVGPGAVVLVTPPICTDLVSIGAGAVIREECLLPGYRVDPEGIRPGPVRIGDDAVIGEASVLGIDTVVGDRAVVGTVSCVPDGGRIPTGASVQGSPPLPTTARFDRVERLPVDRSRRAWFTVTQLAGLALVTAPAGLLGIVAVAAAGGSVASATPLTGAAGGLVDLGVTAAALYLGGLVLAGASTLVLPRVLHRLVTTGVAHPLYGHQWRLARAVQRHSNNVVLNTIFGDSSMIVGYLKAVGYDLSRSNQTGSNFGVDQRHHDPFLVSFDRNTLVSDGLRLLNTEISATSFEVRPIAMPPDTYLGNDVRYPADSRVGPGCLIATKAAVPVDGPVRSGVGLLGSPAFEIPRSVARDLRFDHYRQPGALEKQLAGKLRSNLVTAGLYLLRSWLLLAWTMALTLGAFSLVEESGIGAGGGPVGPALAVALASGMALWSGAVLAILAERAVRGFRPLEPLYCSLYDRRFWLHERFWKLNYNALLRVFDGTPYKPVLLRLQGARVGRMVFDDGGGLTEPTLVELGDGVVMNHRSTIQCHSLEDGTFKSDRTRIGAGSTLGVGAFVHYGVTIEPGATVDADSFVMKGSTVPAGATWRGNPARDVETDPIPPSPDLDPDPAPVGDSR